MLSLFVVSHFFFSFPKFDMIEGILHQFETNETEKENINIISMNGTVGHILVQSVFGHALNEFKYVIQLSSEYW